MKIEVIEGGQQWLDGGAMFSHVPKTLWSQWCQVDEMNRIPLACRCLSIEVEGETIVFDAGLGTFFSPKDRKRFGVMGENHPFEGRREPDHIVLSHLHFDHAGGLLAPYEKGRSLRLFFNHTHYWVTKEAFERAKAPGPRDHASFIRGLPELLEASGRLHFFDQTLPWKALEVHSHSNGHTLGMAILKVGTLYLVTDLIPGTAWVHLPVTLGFDRYAEKKVEEKQRLLEEVVQEGGTLFLTHDPQKPFCRVIYRDSRFVPLEVETDIESKPV